jgi:putative DNA primase/helicase
MADTFARLDGRFMSNEPLPDRTDELLELYKSLQPHDTTQPQRGGQVSPTLADQEIIERARNARNGDKFERLYAGDVNGHASPSEADEALCFILAFYTQDFAQIDRIFRGSGLMRDKWDRKTGGGTYGSMTINKALDQVTETYRRPQNVVQQGVAPRKENTVSVDLTFPHLTDLGNAERLAIKYGYLVRHNHIIGRWFIFDSRRWLPDIKGEIYQLANKTIRQTQKQALNLKGNEDRRKALMDFAMKSESRSRIENMVAMAKSLEGVAILPEEFDRDHYLFNVLNGTVDLRTGELRPHSRDNLITKLSPVEYNPKADAVRAKTHFL